MRNVKVLTDNGVNVTKSLELLGDMETYDEILEEFLEEMQNKLGKAKHFMETKDLPNYAVLTHALKSAARYLGFDELGEIFYKHEMEGKASNFSFVENHFNDLIKAAFNAKVAITTYLSSSVEDSSVIDNQANLTPQSGIKPRTLIVADDSDLIKNIVKRIFEGETEFSIAFVADGVEAIELIESDTESNIIGMLLDLNMPNKDGFEVLEYLKVNSLFSKIPVSIISGNDDKENVQKAFNYPIKDMLRKPFSEFEIKNIVAKTIR